MKLNFVLNDRVLSSEIYPIDADSIRFTFQNGTLDVIVRCADITQEHCDAIVNPTASSMCPDGGVDSHVHNQMGQFYTDQVVAIHKDKNADACPVGQSRIFISKFDPEKNDPRYVINTAGPTYNEEEKEMASFLLKSCYYTSLALANLYQLTSIAFPAISCGARKFPANEAARVAIESIREFSHNIKDVRFVLGDRATYSVFIEEWTMFAENLNNETQGIVNPRPSIPQVSVPSRSNASSAELCVLCKQNPVSDDHPHRCVPCSSLNRSSLFRNILSELRRAAEKKFDQLQNECQKLRALLSLYKISYDPVQNFQQKVHYRDTVAEYFVQNHCNRDMRYHLPVSITGDGNCFYNTFVALTGTTGNPEAMMTPVELRARNIIELVLNRQAYQEKYNNLLVYCDPFEQYVVKEMVRDGSYVATWDFFSMSTVLNIHIISIYPRVNGNADQYQIAFNNASFTPLASQPNGDASAKIKEVRILFSSVNRPVRNREWLPNHFVPLLRLS